MQQTSQPLPCRWCVEAGYRKETGVPTPFQRAYGVPTVLTIVILAAIITPTSDAFTLLLVSLPVYLLYEVSIWVVRK